MFNEGRTGSVQHDDNDPCTKMGYGPGGSKDHSDNVPPTLTMQQHGSEL